MTVQAEAVSQIINSVDSSVFLTQPAKSVESSFERYFPEATLLLDSNDPYAHVLAFLGEEPERLTTVVTNGTSVFKSLPLFSSALFKSLKIVSQVELTNFDFSIITSLRDLNLPILVSYTSNESVLLSKVAYNLAERFGKPVFHFFAPSNYKTKLTANTKGKTLLDRIEGYDYEDILSKLGARNFTFLNTKKSKDLVVFLGQPNESLIGAFNKQDISLLAINVYKPFNLENLLKSIPSKVETITFLQQTANSNLYVAPLLLDFFQDYSQFQALKNFSKVISSFLGFIQPEKYDDVIAALAANIRLPRPVQNLFLGKANKTIGTLASKNRNENVANAVEHAFELEQAYLKLLQQTNSSNLSFWNEFRSKSAGSESSPETGYGAFLYYQEKQNDLIDLVYAAVSDIKFQSIDNEKLIELLSRWLVNVRTGSDASNDSTEEIVSLLESDKVSESSSGILSLKYYLKVRKNWIIGSDAWSYDLGASGVHNIITSGKNVNMLIIDSEPYSAKREELNRFRKKDVGLYAMSYGGCYVASVAVYSSYTQALQAFIEAQKFDGPSVILAYLPYKNEFDDTLSILKETKLAVDSGHWPLYRFNPSIENETESFQLDSSNLRAQLRSFLDRENKLTLLAKKDPVLSRNITANAGTEVKSRQSKIADESFNKLLQGLSGPPLTIAFASDGGNAEGVAKKLNRQALAKGLKSMVLAMDDLPMEDFVNETNVVFVTSTSGQGEFPTNGKQFWDALKNGNDLDLSAIKFSVFGLGDSEYWPRKEDKHYYNKPSKDLYAKLRLYGGVELAELGLGDDQDADGFNTGLNEWMPKLWKALGVDKIEGAEEPKPLTNEDMKIQSDYLRGTIVEGLNDQSTGAISAVDQQLTKFHGIYMQDDRDIREERKARGLEPAYAFMVRVRLPGGIATPNQYLKMDELSDERGNGTLKLTTRATFQLHGVVKHDLKPAIRGMNAALMDTLAACGDVNRNVMISALPHKAEIHSQVSQVGSLISEHLLPETTAYHEIWLEGQDEGDKPGDSDNWENRKEGPRKKKTMVAGNALVDYEPLYGPTYLPRKFKIVITVPPYNDVDVYAHDIGLIAIVEDDEVIGFNVVVGGGMGTTHNNKKTYPRTGSMFGFVSKDKVHIACEKIMLVQRDFGDRTNRKHARLKYTIDDMGVDVYKNKVEELLDFKFEEPKPFEIKSNIDYFGWCKDEFGKNHFTAFIENGRIEDTPEFPQKTGLKKIAEFLRDNQKEGEFRLTGNQHILISNINDNDLETIKSLLAEYKLDNTDFSGLRLSSAACVAFPTCGLAMAESERYLPKLISKLEEALEEYGLRHDSIVMRMTGCPNGCARPWVAEVALVGKAYGAYNLMLGGGHHGQRLNKIYRYSIKEDEILDILKPLFKKWSLERQEGEPFGDFCIRTGVIKPTLEGKFFHDDIPEDA